jgi:D-alanyl-lipoteichoic acid acyltransferase DltB (MBOAT superfamily)
MLFNSLAFVVAFPVFCAVYFAVPPRFQLSLLVVGSLGACAAAGAYSFAWLVVITGMGYAFGRRIAVARSRRLLLTALVCVAAPLVVLKYTNLILESVEAALAWVHVRFAAPTLRLPQPVGLSFYTFVVLGYLVDVHIERTEPEVRPSRFLVFTAFFPKFVSGPVERADGFLPQLEEPKRFDYQRVTDGARTMALGYFRKLVVADRLGMLVDPVFENVSGFRGLSLGFVCLVYMFQVYYDFWAYSDIAVGAARILGFDLTWNFNRPYAATSISDYWRRWHISLTQWFFDYIFKPLAAACRSWGALGIALSLMATFVVSGLWHGARWTFVLFGVFHGIGMSLEYVTARWRKRMWQRLPPRLATGIAWAATFAFLYCVDVFFRAPTVGQAVGILGRIFGGIVPDLQFVISRHGSPSSIKALMAGFAVEKIEIVIAVLGVVLVELTSAWGRETPVAERLGKQRAWVRWAAYYAVVGATVFLGAHNQTTNFLYVQF